GAIYQITPNERRGAIENHEQARARGVNANEEIDQGVQLLPRKTLRENGILDQERRAKEQHFADREQGRGDESEERRQQREITVDRLEQNIQNQRQPNVADRLEQVPRKAKSEQRLMIDNVADRRRRVSSDDQFARHVE